MGPSWPSSSGRCSWHGTRRHPAARRRAPRARSTSSSSRGIVRTTSREEGNLARMRRALAAIMFFPRGGSAHAARDLAQWLPDHGWEETIVSGTRRDLGPGADAHSFYRDLDVEVVDFTDALRDPHPLRFGGEGRAPMHPSYEDRPDAPDRVFAGLDDFEFELQVRAWSEALDRARARSFDLLHLHHLTPINEAAARVAPEVPVVGQLHGTELLMLECVAAGPPPSWRHAERWAERVREWAAACRFLIVAPGGIERAESLLEVPHDVERRPALLLAAAPSRATARLAARRRPRIDRLRRKRPQLVRRWGCAHVRREVHGGEADR